eukprot:1148702-Pelagomonas_calceolata.AAC.3
MLCGDGFQERAMMVPHPLGFPPEQGSREQATRLQSVHSHSSMQYDNLPAGFFTLTRQPRTGRTWQA